MSNFLDDLFKRLFNATDKSPVSHKENIIHEPSEVEEALLWMKSDEGREVIGKIAKSYHFKILHIEERPQVHILDSKYARGFAVTYDEPLNEKTFTLVFLAFAQRVLALGYRQVSLDRKMEEISEQVKVTEKYYFKPPLKNLAENELIPQLYGRVTVEKIATDNQPSYLKVVATFYSDRLYQDPKPFDRFLDQLFATEDHEQN